MTRLDFGNKHRYIPKVTKHEESLQLQVCSYLRLQYPDVIFRSDFASGLHLTESQAAKHKRMQSGRAFPDLFIFESRHGYHGLGIELKKDGTTVIVKIGPRKGKISADQHIQEQYSLLQKLQRKGYYADFAIGYDNAIAIIDWYMEKPQNASIF